VLADGPTPFVLRHATDATWVEREASPVTQHHRRANRDPDATQVLSTLPIETTAVSLGSELAGQRTIAAVH
jgi:hypothetical protein